MKLGLLVDIVSRHTLHLGNPSPGTWEGLEFREREVIRNPRRKYSTPVNFRVYSN